MGTDIKVFFENRDNVLDRIIKRIGSWDKGPESAMEIIEENQKDIEELRFQEELFQGDNLDYRDESYLEKIIFILEEEKKIASILAIRQDEVKEILQQLSKKDIIKENYIKQKTNSIFVDKDF